MLRSLLPALRSRLRAEEGYALLLALASVVCLGTLGASVSYYVSHNATAADRGLSEQRARSLAEAGLNNALAVLWAAGDPVSASSVPTRSNVPLEHGTVGWSASLAGNTWTLRGTGTYRGSPGTPAITTTRSLDVQVVRQPILDIWLYLYSDATTGCMTLSNNGVIAAPLYVRGNFCVSNNAHVTGSPLQVGGYLDVGNNGSVGYPNAELAEADLAGGCLGAGGTTHACTSADDVYATTINRTIGTLTKPPVDLPYWYANAKPGPLNRCSDGTNPFDDDTTLNGSVATAFNLAPAAAYDCRTYDANGELVGQLKWTPGNPGTLVVKGVVFFDRNLLADNNANVLYSGRATIYTSGTILLNNNTHFCGIANCADTWDPDQNLIIFVAGAATGTGFRIDNNSWYQGGAYVVNDYVVQNNGKNWGPVIAHQLSVANNANQVKPLHSLPLGAPADYTTSLRPVAGTYR